MYKLSWAIRIKDDWQTKLKDPEIRQRWREHVLDSQEHFPVEEQLTSNMVRAEPAFSWSRYLKFVPRSITCSRSWKAT